MTVRTLARDLISLKTELQDKEVKVLMPNGEIMPCKIKFVPKDKYNLEISEENIDYIYLTCD